MSGVDVIVIGGGLVGCAAALAMCKAGLVVTVIERDVCGRAASAVNFGGVRRQGRGDGQLHLAMRAHAVWPRLRDLVGTDGEYVRSGHLKLARSVADLDRLAAYAAHARSFGLALEIIDGAAFRRRFPEFGDAVVGGSLSPEDGQANPRLVAPAFASAAAAAGATILEQRAVADVTRAKDFFLVRLSDGTQIEAPYLVNSAGAGGADIAALLGDVVPLRRDYPTIGVTEPRAPTLSACLGIEGGGFYARQVARGNVIIGGGFGEGEGWTSRPGSDAMAQVARNAVAIVPALSSATVIRYWSGVEGYLPDKNGILGWSTTTPGLLHAFGFSGGGFQIAPAIGEVVGKLIATGQSPVPLDAFAPDRFSSPRLMEQR